ncbi:RICIN domain-containing protein [Dactylosporangium sp. AC04546]|uniref:RICIN domain-containing protein n=1 Tax=Dactylosporangium sp. AC04546 TaxID=2862460 RepID=UPI001EDDB310|nr:RICIN domain-containing protein [Dactylosporangium sp. AC04546]WVK80539.1 RICIN domain-containing protein [Dactylosporangium sp. AC04546]
MHHSHTPGLPRRDLLRRTAIVAGAAVAGPLVTAAEPTHAAVIPPGGNLQQAQQRFVDLRFGMFIHFNMGTFHDAEWVQPDRDPLTFNPTALDCGQWAAAAKSAGMTFGVLTAKHHDGFCLWPSAQTTYNVMSSSVRRDVVRLYVDAFRAAGLQPALYFSIWDRNQGVAKDSMSAADIAFVKAQITELLTGYGPIPALVIDGWAWQMGHRQAPYGEIRDHIKALQPDIILVDHNGQTEPFEEDAIYFEEPKGIWAPVGNTYACCQGQNIVNTGWFWHPSTPNATPLSADNIVNGHLRVLESRYCTFMLNCPPNTAGQLDANIVNRLREVGPLWTPNLARPALPAQPDVLDHVVTPVAVTSTSGTATNAIDGILDYTSRPVQTLWQSTGALPQSVTLDLGAVYSNLDMLTCLPRQDGTTTGNITSYRILASTDGVTYTQITAGAWSADKTLKRASFPPLRARYLRLEAVDAVGGSVAVVSEIDCGGVAARPVSGGTGYWNLINRNSGKALDVTAASLDNGAPVIQWTSTNATNQQWQLVHVGAGYCKLISRHSGKVLDVTGASTADGAPVIQWTDTTSANQLWKLVGVGDGYHKLVCYRSGKLLDVTGPSTSNGVQVVQSADHGTASQQWRLTNG